MNKAPSNSFKLNPVAAAIAMAMAAQFPGNLAYAGSGWGYGNYVTNPAVPVPVQTYYANSPAGSVTKLDPVTGLPTVDPVTNLPLTIDTGKALRKFVDTLPGLGSANMNNLGQYIPVAVPEKWTDANGNKTDDYYEIAAVEYSEKMHSDLPKATRLRGYVQLMTPGLVANGVVGKNFTTLDGRVLSVVDTPHHLGPVIQAASGTAVRVKFTNYLPVGGNLFLPVDKSITGAGLGPDGKTYYTENRAEIHLVGGEAPWVSAGTPHQWVAPAGETAAYTAGLGKGASAQNVPDMADPGAGSTTLYFPNTQSARFMFYQDRTSGLTRLNSYAGLEAGYFVTDPTEKALVSSGVIPADQIPLIIEDKTFVPANIAQQDAKWDTAHWGQSGDLWFPHVYETNQDPNSVNGVNPVGRWDYGPWFWPIFPATQALPPGGWDSANNRSAASFTPEAYQDTPVINGTAYPTLTVDPKAYRFRILNASNDRFINLGWYKADSTQNAPQLDRNGNPVFDANGNQLYFANTEVKMVPAVGDANGNPPNWDATAGVQLPLPQYPQLKTNNNVESSGPSRAWPVDARIGGAPDPTTAGPDFIAIGNDGGLLPNAVDIPSQPVTYEANRRSVTVGNIYGYGLLLGPAERSDAVVDFSAYAGQTLILYNDAPAPAPFIDSRVDYFTGDPDQTGIGGTYSTKPGYGPNTRTMMQVKVNAAAAGVTPPAYNAGALLTALPAAYKASQPAPIVPESVYNAAFGTNDADNYAHVATGSVAQPTLDFTPTPASGIVTITGVNLISSGGQVVVGTANIVGNPIPGSGTGYTSAPTVSFALTGTATCLPLPVATAVVDNTSNFVAATANHPAIVAGHTPSYQVIDVNMVTQGVCTAAPQVIFSGGGGVGAQGTVVATAGGTPISQSILVQTKAEQELFDASGRYNSTGGVEIPLTSGTTQTTVPLNYIDSATEIIGDNEVQIWKIVDNGFWSNSIHFDFVDVQLINRVGWDGTLKPPASNEVGWKDTLRLNPLEDVIVAMRAKRPAVPFGQPASKRLQDPSKPAGAAGSGLGFTVDPAVTSPAGTALLTTPTNVVANYDHEFVWNSAILGHSENDLMRPIVYHPTVTLPTAPTIMGGTGGALIWTDATPAGAAATLGNPANEVGFTVLKAPITGPTNTVGAYAPIATLPANTIAYTDTAIAGANSYEVVAFNNAGSATSAPWIEVSAPAVPTWVATNPVVVNANGTVRLTWNKATGATGYIITANGTAFPLIAAAGVGTTQSATVTLPWGVNYTSITVTAQIVFTGVTPNVTANSAPSAPVSANLMSFPATPAAPTASSVLQTTLTLNWSAAAGATTYTVQRASNAAFTAGLNTIATGVTGTSQAVTGLTAGATYYFRVVAVNSANTAYPATGAASAAVTMWAATPGVPTVTSTGVTAIGFTLNWNAPTGATSYIVTVNGVAQPSQTGTSFVVTGALPGTSNGPYTVQACDNNGATCSAASTAVTVVTPPVAPAAPTTASVAATSLTLNWSAAAGATTYNVQQASNAAFTTGLNTIATGVTGTSQAVTGLTAGATYYFRVQAVNGGNTVSGTASAAVTTLAATPAAPAFGTSTGVSAIGFTLNWNAPTGATSYIVTANGVVQPSQTGTSFVVTGALPGTSNGPYTVQACNNGGATCSAASTPVTVVTPPVAPAAPTTASVATTSLTLNWSAAAGATTYNVQRASNATFTTGLNTIATGVTGTSQAVTGLTANTPYYFRVQAVNGANTVSGTSSAVVLTLPSTPTAPTAANGAVGGAITGGLTWTTPAGGAASYRVDWTAPAGVLPATGFATATSGQQLTFATAGTYSMTVTAVNATGSSLPSAAVNVTVR